MDKTGQKVMVLIDKFFPYERGEEFLENEIKYALKYVDKLVIVPMEAKDFSNNRLLEDSKISIVRRPKIRNRWIRLLPCIINLFNPKVWMEARTQNKLLGWSYKMPFKVASAYEYQKYVIKQTWNLVSPLLSENDNVIFYSYWLDKCALMAGEFGNKWKSARTISRAHRFDVYCEEIKYFLPFRSKILSNLNYIYLISDDGKKYMDRKFKEFSSKFGVMRLGTTDYGVCGVKKGNTFRIVSCSSCATVKRVEKIVEALSSVKQKIEWIHYGDGELRSELEKTASEKLPPNIKWKFAGQVLNKDLMQIYKTTYYDVFVNVSESEGIPVSIMEAISFGIPVIATNVGGTSEIVTDGSNGFLLNKDFAPKDLADKILFFYNLNSIEQEKFRSNARDIWGKNFSADVNYTSFYNRIYCVEERE